MTFDGRLGRPPDLNNLGTSQEKNHDYDDAVFRRVRLP
jgi:hypothetical protein